MSTNVIRLRLTPLLCVAQIRTGRAEPQTDVGLPYIPCEVKGRWEPVVGPGFVGLHPQPGEFRRNLPVCVPGLWVRRSWGPRGRSLQPLVPSAAAKWEGCVTASQAAPSPSSGLFSPGAVVSTQGTITMPKSLRYCYPRDSRLWIQNTTLGSSVLASLVASLFCRITSHCLHEEQFLQTCLNNCLSGNVNHHFQSKVDTRS